MHRCAYYNSVEANPTKKRQRSIFPRYNLIGNTK